MDRYAWIACVLTAGCGRIGFDAMADGGHGDPRLASIEVWAAPHDPVGVFAPVFDPDTRSYTVDLGLVLQSVQLSATPIDPSTTIEIGGAATGSAILGPTIPLVPGATPIDVTGISPDGARATYTVTISRASALAQQAYIKPSNTKVNFSFGVAIARSGDTLAIGAPGEPSNATGIDGDQSNAGAAQSGAVYVFVERAGVWHQEAYIKASNTETLDNFGLSLALDGDTLAVGAYGEDSAATGIDGNQMSSGAIDSGAIYVFRRSAAVWHQEAYIKASNTGASDLFGVTVALEGDTLVVGADHESSNARGVGGDQTNDLAPFSGAVYVFGRIGTTWAQEAYIKASNTDSNDTFGNVVALEGDTLVISAPFENSAATGVDGDQADNTTPTAGAVYVFSRRTGVWAQEAYLKASNTDVGDLFGSGLAIAGDTIAVGAGLEDGGATGINGNQADNSAVDSGAVYVFVRTGGTWAQQAYLKASNNRATSSFRFGDSAKSVRLADDTLLVGAFTEDSSATGINGNQGVGAANTGAVYAFTRSGGTWTQLAYIKASNTNANDTFGDAIAFAGDTFIVTATGEASHATGIDGDQTDNSMGAAGAAYLFH